MSCFVVPDFHVSALVAYAIRADILPDAVSPDALAHELASANRAAFSDRYAGRYDSELAPFGGLDRSAGAELAPVAIVKACDCFEYQASDWPAWRESEAAAHLAAIRATAQAACLAGRYYPEPRHDLPGYESAPWCLDEPEPDLVTEARATVAALQGLAVHPSHYAGLVAALARVDQVAA